MTPEQFAGQMQRLVGTYGKVYGEERSKLIWNKARWIEAHEFGDIIDRLIGSCRQAPLIPEFESEFGVLRERKQSQRDRKATAWTEPTGYACDYCRDNGVYIATHTTQGGRWAFRCHCMRGRQDPRTQIPHYTDDHKAEFTWTAQPQRQL